MNAVKVRLQSMVPAAFSRCADSENTAFVNGETVRFWFVPSGQRIRVAHAFRYNGQTHWYLAMRDGHACINRYSPPVDLVLCNRRGPCHSHRPAEHGGESEKNVQVKDDSRSQLARLKKMLPAGLFRYHCTQCCRRAVPAH